MNIDQKKPQIKKQEPQTKQDLGKRGMRMQVESKATIRKKKVHQRICSKQGTTASRGTSYKSNMKSSTHSC